MVKRIVLLVCAWVLCVYDAGAQMELLKNDRLTYRPGFHFAPTRNWTNDPNGLVYYNGRYHMFYQYNPYGDLWGHMTWAHAVSKDLIKWEDMPVAIPEYKNSDGTTTMIFSGTAVADKTNSSGLAGKEGKTPLVAIYTSHIVDSNGKATGQSQSMAYSLDGIKFTLYDKNPLIDLHTKAFRDPKVFWHRKSGKWVMIVAKPTDYLLQFYGSPDLKNWKLLSSFGGGIGDKSKIWECPDIFELPVKNAAGESKWVITVSGGHPQQNNFPGMQYFTGTFDGNAFSADKQDSAQYIDYGKDYYAGIVYNCLPENDKRQIMIGWASSWIYARNIPTKGFRGQMAIPRELSMFKIKQGKYLLCSYPVKEVEKYREKILFNQAAISIREEKLLNGVNEDKLDIQFTLFPGTASQSGIKLLKNTRDETVVYYNKADSSIKLDRTKSGNTSFSPKFSSIESVPVPVNRDGVPVRILVDKNSIEVFINGGKQVITDLVFPSTENAVTALFAAGGEASFRDVKIWRMKSPMQPAAE